jgi:lipopolysaccharide/colanic/teichoic acid biosynthesis glycosyltransferase
MKFDHIRAAAVAEPIFSEPDPSVQSEPMASWTMQYRVFKRSVDILFALAVLPTVGMIALILIVVNPFLNPGPVFYRQSRMGLGGRRFTMWKFRTMKPCAETVRAFHARVEEDRITRFGRFLRTTRIDEFPNVINILRAEMTLIGPRPDAWEHAVRCIDEIPYYRDRFRVKPGITGLAQVRAGYADTRRAMQRKARLDRFYVHRTGTGLDLRIMRETVRVMCTGFGAK